jgi:hypothetical protein
MKNIKHLVAGTLAGAALAVVPALGLAAPAFADVMAAPQQSGTHAMAATPCPHPPECRRAQAAVRQDPSDNPAQRAMAQSSARGEQVRIDRDAKQAKDRPADGRPAPTGEGLRNHADRR